MPKRQTRRQFQLVRIRDGVVKYWPGASLFECRGVVAWWAHYDRSLTKVEASKLADTLTHETPVYRDGTVFLLGNVGSDELTALAEEWRARQAHKATDDE